MKLLRSRIIVLPACGLNSINGLPIKRLKPERIPIYETVALDLIHEGIKSLASKQIAKTAICMRMSSLLPMA